MRFHFLAKFVHALSLSWRNLFTWNVFQRVFFLFQLSVLQINYYFRSYMLHFYINLRGLTELIKFMFNCSISNFCSTMASSKSSVLVGFITSFPFAQVLRSPASSLLLTFEVFLPMQIGNVSMKDKCTFDFLF